MKRKYNLTEDAQLKMKTVFSKPHVEIVDGVQNIMLNKQEWDTFLNYLPCIRRYITHLIEKGSYMVDHIDRVMRSDHVYVPPPQELDSVEADRLHDEVVAYKAMHHSIN